MKLGSMSKPIVLHTREAEADTVDFLKRADAARVRGVLHCYTGSVALAEAALADGDSGLAGGLQDGGKGGEGGNGGGDAFRAAYAAIRVDQQDAFIHGGYPEPSRKKPASHA